MPQVVIEAREVSKTFQVPEHRMDSFKERLTHPLTKVAYRELRALRDVSFDVHRGEFFGIVGRNGSGKSTLLKVLASIYRADGGSIRMAGRLAPFIELGVGFDSELTAKENAILNGVLMGMTARESRRRLDAVLDFAELQEFEELKLKNYSSGMMVRLAFAVMVQAEADIMLIDEVLAVGDAAFARKCMDVFHERHAAGTTIVLVTHDMATVQDLCDRAMLIHDGEMQHVGDSEEATRQYYRLNHVRAFTGVDGRQRLAHADLNVKVVHANVFDAAHQPAERLADGEPIRLKVVLEARRDLQQSGFVLQARNQGGTVVFTVARDIEQELALGEQITLEGEIEHSLVPGEYTLDCWVYDESEDARAMQGLSLLRFEVDGTAPTEGLISVRADIEVMADRRPVA